ncbi:MAG: hypothetical protein KME50_13720 [Nostoc desertorum CM1-VF14]|jgi:predicted nucleic acid-binding protein|nr:hypothetical protein [Nostoc desertorum CM1-VF14]
MKILTTLLELFVESPIRCSIFYLWRTVARDPDDDFLIDLAVECQADFIITYNQKDLQAAQKFGLRVGSPKEFLQIVGEIP